MTHVKSFLVFLRKIFYLLNTLLRLAFVISFSVHLEYVWKVTESVHFAFIFTYIALISKQYVCSQSTGDSTMRVDIAAVWRGRRS